MSTDPNQVWRAEQYATNARFVSDLGLPVVELLDPHAGERILDLGCGDGALTLRLVELGCRVVGVDASPDMVGAAQARGLDARVVDGHDLRFQAEFDAVFSNAALHWMKQPGRVLAGVRAALVPGGRFVGEFGGQGNVATILAALTAALARRGIDAAPLSPFWFPDPDEFRRLLEAHGFAVREIGLFPRPTPLPGSLVAWFETFAQPFSAAVPRAGRGAFLDEVAEACRPTLCDAAGRWQADYVRLRFAAQVR
jgi:SAM-dependent methyltransferase